MKKSLVALAALATLGVAGVASAQSSVTLFGVVDAAISYQSTTTRVPTAVLLPGFPAGFIAYNDIKQSNWALRNSGMNSSRLGFRGTEDLGGGLAASFWLESQLGNDDTSTNLNMSRRSTVSLSGGFGEVRLGRDYVPTFWNDTIFDPFGTNGSGTNVISTINASGAFSATNPWGGIGNVNAVRASNSIGYFLPPNLGGFYGQFMYGLHENVKTNAYGFNPASDTSAGRYVGGRVGYANGPLDVALAYGESTASDTAAVLNPITFAVTPAKSNKVKTANLGASYDFGPAKLFGELSQTRNQFNGVINPAFGPAFQSQSYRDRYNGYLIGVTVPVGAGLIRASYSGVRFKDGQDLVPLAGSPLFPFFSNGSSPKVDKFAIGYVYNLSKRTALYATAAYTKNKNDNNYLGGLTAAATNNFNNAPASANPGFIKGGSPRNAIGYDFGVKHSF